LQKTNIVCIVYFFLYYKVKHYNNIPNKKINMLLFFSQPDAY